MGIIADLDVAQDGAGAHLAIGAEPRLPQAAEGSIRGSVESVLAMR